MVFTYVFLSRVCNIVRYKSDSVGNEGGSWFNDEARCVCLRVALQVVYIKSDRFSLDVYDRVLAGKI